MLRLHRSERADALVEALAAVLGTPVDDPLVAEVVSVPTRGVERWLTQRLSHRLGTSGAGRGDGVCANVEFPFPGRLVGDALAAATGIDRDRDPWRPERAVWPLIDVIDERIEEEWLAAVRSHLDAVGPALQRRRFATARHVADLFDRYAIHRPWMVRSWQNGDDVDASGVALRADARWQPRLWRHLHDRIGVPGPAERLAGACGRLVEEPSLADLPDRFAIFGLTRLPASYLDVLEALAAHRDVHLFLLHPSDALWSRMPAAPTRLRRSDDPTRDLPKHPLLASWGRDSREMQLVVSGGAADDVHHPVDAAPPVTLLERIQHAVRADEWPPVERPPLDPGDRSIGVHACHGRARQVEVLRDAVLHLLAADPTLEPRDVIVMCPDIEDFAPLIHATFGAGDFVDADDDEDAAPASPMPDLRVRLADRALRQTNPVLGATADLLEIAAGRVTAPQVLDFAGREPVRRRFGFDDDDIARLKAWVAHTGIRWGLDAEHRRPWIPEGGLEANTWQAGLRRVLAGAAMAEEDERLVGGRVLPLDDVDSGSIELAGRFAELVTRLGDAVRRLSTAQATGAEWAQRVGDAADALMATAEADAWQRTQLQRILDDVRDEASTTATDATLSLAELRALVGDRLRGQPTRANFRTGHLTVCTLVPMRSVPHRVVCLLGLDDGAFPRVASPDGDDLVADDPHVGDRDSRGEDRQLLLDALLAATETLVITYTGRDERTNARRPPSVPVGELLDCIDRTVVCDRAQLVTEHPLQPFDPRNFDGRGPRSFDVVNLDGARALAAERHAPPAFLREVLPPPAPSAVVELDGLVRFVQHPVKAFLRQRLNVSLGDWSEDVDEAIPVELDHLDRWSVGDRVVDRLIAGADLADCIAAERARGDLPPGRLADPLIDDICVAAVAVADAALERAGGAPTSVEVRVALDDGRVLVGTVAGLVDGSVLRAATYSKLAPKHRLASWVRFLALTASRPDKRFEAITVGRPDNKRKKVAVASLPAIDGDVARRLLHELVDIYDRGLREPLPIYCKTSAAYAAGKPPGGEWTTQSFRHPKEDAEAEHELVRGGRSAIEDVLAEPPRDDEKGDGWDENEASRFGRYAKRLWAGLLIAERVEES